MMSDQDNHKPLANFFYEVGHLKRILRAGQASYLTTDPSDNIAGHSFRAAVIAWYLAHLAGADQNKCAAMALFHDIAEVRSNDHNWIAKKYVKVFEDEIMTDQTAGLPNQGHRHLVLEYEERESLEARLAKDADVLELVLTLKELSYKGNKEAENWLSGKPNEEKDPYRMSKWLKTDIAKEVIRAIYDTTPTEWWHNTWTNINR